MRFIETVQKCSDNNRTRNVNKEIYFLQFIMESKDTNATTFWLILLKMRSLLNEFYNNKQTMILFYYLFTGYKKKFSKNVPSLVFVFSWSYNIVINLNELCEKVLYFEEITRMQGWSWQKDIMTFEETWLFRQFHDNHVVRSDKPSYPFLRNS